jgi:hypothetical protein
MKLAEVAPFLSRMRAHPATWSEMAYTPGPDHEDANRQVRRACLLGLQHDRRSTDRDLILYLLEQEVLARTGFSGCSTSLEAAVFFAAELDDPAIAWRIMAAKFANFDTSCAIGFEALYSCGVERTLAMLQASNRVERKDFPPAPLQEEVDAWWSSQRSSFPVQWEDEPDKVATCREVGDFEAGSEYLSRQLAGTLSTLQPGSAEERNVLVHARYEWTWLGRTDQAARIQEKLDKSQPESAWDRASALRDALATYASAGRFDDAASKVEPLRAALMQLDSWRYIGLGRMSAEAMADFAISVHDKAVAAHVFAVLEEMMTDGLPLPTLAEISSDPQFEPREISRDEFETLWREKTTKVS